MNSLAMAVAAVNLVRRARATQANFPALIRTEHLHSAVCIRQSHAAGGRQPPDLYLQGRCKTEGAAGGAGGGGG
jgi:hypothetical protein